MLERLAAVVGLNPMDTLQGPHEPLSEGVRILLLGEIQQILERLRDMAKWLHALDPALQVAKPRSPDGNAPSPPNEEHQRLKAAPRPRKPRRHTE
jgi:hypothetical protein